jgi:hypothetical protein
MEGKYVFTTVTVCVLGAIQIIAFVLGVDGQVLAFTTAGITALVSFILGLNITPPSTKAKIVEEITAINKENLSKP